MRHATSCRQCRAGKRKCHWGQAQAACYPCIQRREECSRSNHVQNRPELTPKTSTSLSISETLEMVDLYFTYIHDRPHSLFHVRSLRDSVLQGTVDRCLLLAICAMGCRFSSRYCAEAMDLQVQVITLFSTQLEDVTLSNIQTCILIANLHAASGNSVLEALYFGIANRMAHLCHLYEESETDSFILREVKRRVLSSLYMADRWCLPSLAVPRALNQNNSRPERLMDEVEFQKMTESQALPTWRDGIWQHKIALASIFGDIQDFNQSLVQSPAPTDDEVDRYVLQIGGIIDRWPQTLPDHLVLSEENLQYHRSQAQGGTFVALHLGYHHYATLLYFQYLDKDHTLSAARPNADRCRSHALSYSRLLRWAREMNCHVVYLTVVQMTMVSSAVLLHTLLFGPEADVVMAREQLTSNFEALIDLRRYWPSVSQMTQRLLSFQDACLQFAPGSTHRLDRWMIRFLLEYSLPLQERVAHDMPKYTTPSQVSSNREQMLHQVFEDLRR